MRFCDLLGVGLGGFDIIRDKGQYLPDVIAQGQGRHVPAGWHKRAGEIFPFGDDGGRIGANEFGEAHMV
jgi:hypothetical protein